MQMKAVKGIDSIKWEPHGHKRQSQGFVGSECVGIIHKNKNHTYTNSGIYSVTIMGTELRERFRGIDEARLAGQRAYNERTSTK
jgi:hypothetical protein